MVSSEKPFIGSSDDVWLADRCVDEAFMRLSPFQGVNPLPYSIADPSMFQSNVGIHWSARPMVWEALDLPYRPLKLTCRDWALDEIAERYIEPLQGSLGSDNRLANALILAEHAGESFERFMRAEGFLVRWQPFIRHREWDEQSTSGMATDELAALRVFASPEDAERLEKPGSLMRMRKAFEGYLKHFAGQFLSHDLPWQKAGIAYPTLANVIDESPFGADEGHTTTSLSAPRMHWSIDEATFFAFEENHAYQPQ